MAGEKLTFRVVGVNEDDSDGQDWSYETFNGLQARRFAELALETAPSLPAVRIYCDGERLATVKRVSPDEADYLFTVATEQREELATDGKWGDTRADDL
jgi:hypothetical protein